MKVLVVCVRVIGWVKFFFFILLVYVGYGLYEIIENVGSFVIIVWDNLFWLIYLDVNVIVFLEKILVLKSNICVLYKLFYIR